jgi:hypothetical protein
MQAEIDEREKHPQAKNGEPFIRPLRRFANNKSAQTHQWHTCCGCGFRHFVTYDVFRQPQGRDEYWIAVRYYADEDTRPKKRGER